MWDTEREHKKNRFRIIYLWLFLYCNCTFTSEVYILLFDLLGMKKGEKMHIFPPIGKKYAYFFPTNWLKIYKIAPQKSEKFIKYNYFIWGKKSGRGGGWGKKLIQNLIYTPDLLLVYISTYIQNWEDS